MKESSPARVHVNFDEVLTATTAGIVVGFSVGSVLTKNATVSEGVRMALCAAPLAIVGAIGARSREIDVKKTG